MEGSAARSSAFDSHPPLEFMHVTVHGDKRRDLTLTLFYPQSVSAKYKKLHLYYARLTQKQALLSPYLLIVTYGWIRLVRTTAKS